MDVTVAESGPCRRTLSISIPAEEVQSRLDEAFRNASSQVQMKGFRAGKVPRKVLEQRYGEAIRQETRQRLLNESVHEACREHELELVNQPSLGEPPVDGKEPSEDDIPEMPEIRAGEPFEFTVYFDIRPSFELMDVSTIEVEAEPTEVTDDDVDQALNQLAEQKKTLEAVEEPIQEGDFITADLEFFDEGGASIQKRDGAKLNTNLPIAGTEMSQFQAALAEKSAGDKVEIELTFPDTFEIEDARGKSGKVSVAITEVQRVTPASIDDELAKGFDFETLDALKDVLRERIGMEKAQAERTRQENLILDRLVEEHPFELPESMVESQKEGEIQRLRQQLAQQAAQQGQNPEEVQDEIEAKVEELRPQADEHAVNFVRSFYLMDQIARTNEIFVSEQDVEAQFQGIAAQNGMEVAEVKKIYEQRNMVGEIRLSVLERKVRNWLRETAKITGETESDGSDLGSGSSAADTPSGDSE